MAYVSIENFAAGVDQTRPIYVGPQGTLWQGINGHLSRGGDFEKRKAFVETFTLANDTFGLQAVGDATLYCFGSVVTPGTLITTTGGVTSTQPVNYQRLQHFSVGASGTIGTTAEAMTAVLSTHLFNGLPYVIAQYSNADICHFYNGTAVADWGTGYAGEGANPVSASGEVATIARTHQRKVYALAGSFTAFSDLDDATQWSVTTSTVSGYINMSTHQSGSTDLSGLAVYQRQLAIFARRVIQIWNMFDDDADNSPAQILDNAGTRSPKSVLSFADYDVFFLSDSGIRSLRARDSSTSAAVNDVGVPIDKIVLDHMATLTDAQIAAAVAIIEPIDGRFWLALGNKMFVFTYFPSKKISGWTWYEPGISFTDFTRVGTRVWGRAGNLIYLYGGENNTSYDGATVTCWLPFMSFGRPSTPKQLKGFDIAASGRWTVDLLVNPENLSEYSRIGTSIGEVTQWQENIAATGIWPAVSLKMTHAATVAASVSAVQIHYMKGKDE